MLAPGTIQAANAVALQASSDLTTAYLDAAGRVTEFTTVSDLTSGTPLLPGVYANASRGPLLVTGAMTLDGQNNPDAVFIFQTDSTLITGSGSVVNLINGASECNIFWQVGSSATIGTGSAFVGNILALTSIAVQTGATIQGRALARNGEVTLDTNVFTSPNCALSPEGAPAATTIACGCRHRPGRGARSDRRHGSRLRGHRHHTAEDRQQERGTDIGHRWIRIDPGCRSDPPGPPPSPGGLIRRSCRR